MVKYKIEMIRKKDNAKMFKIISLSVLSFAVIIFFKKNFYEIKSKNIKPVNFSYDILKEKDKNIFNALDLETQNSYIIYDIKNATSVSEVNSTTKYPLASITKLMTAYLALSDCKYSDVEKIKHMLVISSNEDADEIADQCGGLEKFVNKMNGTANLLGLNMTFENPSGLDKSSDTVATAFGDSLSVAKLIALMSKKYPNIMDSTTHGYYDGAPNTNAEASSWPFLLASKTGFTDVAGGNLATVFSPSPEEEIAIVVLGSTRERRFQSVLDLLKKYIENIK